MFVTYVSIWRRSSDHPSCWDCCVVYHRELPNQHPLKEGRKKKHHHPLIIPFLQLFALFCELIDSTRRHTAKFLSRESDIIDLQLQLHANQASSQTDSSSHIFISTNSDTKQSKCRIPVYLTPTFAAGLDVTAATASSELQVSMIAFAVLKNVALPLVRIPLASE